MEDALSPAVRKEGLLGLVDLNDLHASPAPLLLGVGLLEKIISASLSALRCLQTNPGDCA